MLASVDGLFGLCAVEIDEMQPVRRGGRKALRHLHRVVRNALRGLVIALKQPNRHAVLQVDGR